MSQKEPRIRVPASLSIPLPIQLSYKLKQATVGSSEPTNAECCGGYCSTLIIVLSYVVLILTFPFSLICSLKVVMEYERAVVFRLGRLLSGDAKGPGLFMILPCIDSFRKVDLRVISFNIPPQEILSKDSVTVTVDAVVYFRVLSPVISVTNVNDPFLSTKLLAQTTLQSVLGTKYLSEMLSEREPISHMIQSILDDATYLWGVKVERVEMKDIRLPHALMRSMAAEAEASRDARAKVITASGEKKAAPALTQASMVINQSGPAIQLRYLQVLNGIANHRNKTIIFPMPVDLLKELFLKMQNKSYTIDC